MVILENGRPAEGFDHPIVEAVSSILTLREPLDVFSLVLAVLFDGVSMLAVFATVGEKRRFPDRLANLRRWMAATTVQLQMMPGILPWLVQSLCDFLWTSPMKADDSRIAALQQSLERLKDEMDEFLVGLPTPPSTLGTISAQLASLFARANVVSFRSSETLKNLALRMYAILSDAGLWPLKGSGSRLRLTMRSQINEKERGKTERIGRSQRKRPAVYHRPGTSIDKFIGNKKGAHKNGSNKQQR
jgi:hypothetical protein